MIIQEDNIEVVEEEEKKEEEKQNSEKGKTGTKHIMVILGIFIGIVFLVLLIIFGIFTIYNIKHNNVIAKGVYIYGIDVSYLSPNEAKEKISPKFQEMVDTNITLKYEDYETQLSASEVDLQFDIDAAINYAYKIGKNGNIFSDNYEVFDTMLKKVNIVPTYSINKEELIKYLDNLSKDLPNAVVESSYYVEDSELIITKGKDGFVVNAEQTANNIKDKIKDFSYLNDAVQLSLTPAKPKDVDLDEIYKKIYKEPTDASYTTNPYNVIPSSNGVDFSMSLDEAKELLKKSENECKIKLKTLYPSVTTNMIGTEAFPDLLATFSTRYNTANKNRTTNLRLAANKINGTVLMPGETFSYNKVVGERTIAAGYKEASIYIDGTETDGLGGGICQISTTLFNAALYANMEMIEVNNHQFVPPYSTTGRDATVVYGTKDFQFKNSRNFAVKIECSVSKGVAKFNIYGLKEENEYDIDISTDITSKTSSYTKSTTYRILKQKGKVVDKQKIYSCTYKAH